MGYFQWWTIGKTKNSKMRKQKMQSGLKSIAAYDPYGGEFIPREKVGLK
jgi:hypothetical protein